MERPTIPRRAAVNSHITCSSPSSTYSIFIKIHRQRTFTPGIIMRDMAVKHTEIQFWLGLHLSSNYAFYKSKCLMIIKSKIIRARQICISLRELDFLRDIPIVEEVARMIWITRINTVNTVSGTYNINSNNQALTYTMEENKAWHSFRKMTTHHTTELTRAVALAKFQELSILFLL